MLLPALARAKAKANRIKCVNNIGNVYKAGLSFAQDNGERHTWQLTSSGVRAHLAKNATANQKYGRSTSGTWNVVNWHPLSRKCKSVFATDAMKVEIVTPKILFSPCDGTRNASSQVVQKNWKSYQTMDVTTGDPGSGDLVKLQDGTSYELVRGADTQRPTSPYAYTRNIAAGKTYLRSGSTKWSGSDNKATAAETISGLTASQGQLVMSDGGARQSNDADLGANGVLQKAAEKATGGVSTFKTSLERIK
jgi:hypothetical protein